MPNQVFNDINLENEFNQKGYVTVPFLNLEEIVFLKEKYFETIEESGGPKKSGNVDYDSKADISYDFTFIDNNIEYKKKVHAIITEKFQSIADKYLNNYKPIIANYIRKKENGGEVPMHQNWAFVDEIKYTSVSIWVPLVDSNEENGTLQMVDGSHKKFGQYRGPMVPWELRYIKEEIIKNNLTPMNVKAGEAVILDDSIVHYSNNNKTSGLRLAIQLIMIPKVATSIHYHLDRDKDTNKIIQLESNVDFYTNFHPWLKPKGMKEIGTISFKEQIYTYTDFLNRLKAKRFDDITKNTISPLFQNSETQIKFDTDGFVKLPLLNEQEVEDLKNYYLSLTHEHIGEYGFHVSLDSRDPKYIDGVFKKLFGVIMPRLNPILNNYKSFTASYVIKEAGLQNIVPPHQDWSFVDEKQFCSATVWIPLMDVNKNNGALGLIKGSHLLFNEPRVSPSPQAKSILSDHMFNLFPFVEVIEMKAGEALIFNNKTIHASPPNISGITRIGAGIGITQKEAGLLHYYQLPNSTEVEVYEVTENFFKEYNNYKLSKIYSDGQKPTKLKLLKTINKSKLKFSKEEITSLVCKTDGVIFNNELMTELAKLYNYNIDGTKKEHASKELVKEQEHNQIENTVNKEIIINKKRFFEVYTIKNIIAEVGYKLRKKINSNKR